MSDFHPSKAIIGSQGDRLKGEKIALCITGSVAAIECPKIARRLMRIGADVFTVMSASAQRIISPYLMEWATGNPVVTKLTGKIEHIALATEGPEKVDLVLIAPATANTINKIACGIADTPVTVVASTALGSGTPILIVPAMHESLYHNPMLEENMRKLRAMGIKFVEPRIEEGRAKIASIEQIEEAVIRELAEKNMAGLKVLVTAGPTIEHIDPIRVITNKSSGKMGIAIAEESARRGADATLILGFGVPYRPSHIRVIEVETTEEMYDAVLSELKSSKYDVFVAAAAVSDFAPTKPYDYRLSANQLSRLTLELEPARKIVNEVKKVSPDTFLVAFKAEYKVTDDQLINSAHGKLKECDADLVVANDVGRKGAGFRADTNEVFVVDREGKVIHIPLVSKKEVARKLLDIIVERLRSREPPKSK